MDGASGEEGSDFCWFFRSSYLDKASFCSVASRGRRLRTAGSSMIQFAVRENVFSESALTRQTRLVPLAAPTWRRYV